MSCVAPVVSDTPTGLQYHFAQPGAVVAQTTSESSASYQYRAVIRLWQYIQWCLCTTGFGLPVVPEVKLIVIGSSATSGTFLTFGFPDVTRSSKRSQPFLDSLEPIRMNTSSGHCPRTDSTMPT